MRKAYVVLALALAGCTTNPVAPLVTKPVVVPDVEAPVTKVKPLPRKTLVIPAAKWVAPTQPQVQQSSAPVPDPGPPTVAPEVVHDVPALPSPLIMDPIKVSPK